MRLRAHQGHDVEERHHRLRLRVAAALQLLHHLLHHLLRLSNCDLQHGWTAASNQRTRMPFHEESRVAFKPDAASARSGIRTCASSAGLRWILPANDAMPRDAVNHVNS